MGATRLAAAAGGRLPLAQEVVDCNVKDDLFEQWQPVGDMGTSFWINTGSPGSGRLHKTERPYEAFNCPAGCGWGDNNHTHSHRPTMSGTTPSSTASSIHYIYVFNLGEQATVHLCQERLCSLAKTPAGHTPESLLCTSLSSARSLMTIFLPIVIGINVFSGKVMPQL